MNYIVYIVKDARQVHFVKQLHHKQQGCNKHYKAVNL